MKLIETFFKQSTYFCTILHKTKKLTSHSSWDEKLNAEQGVSQDAQLRTVDMAGGRAD